VTEEAASHADIAEEAAEVKPHAHLGRRNDRLLLIVLIVAVAILALNKFGIVHLPYTFPIAWLNPSEFFNALYNAGIF